MSDDPLLVRYGWLTALFAPLFVFPPLCGLGIWLGGFGWSVAAIACPIILAVAAQILMLRWTGFWVGGALLLAAIAGAGSGHECAKAQHFRKGAFVRDARADNINGAPDATLFEFRDARVVVALRAEVTRSSRTKNSTTYTTYYVAPLVDNGWTKAMPVYAWVGSTEFSAGWDLPHNGAARLDVGIDQFNGYRMAIANAQSKHGLSGDLNAPVVLWVENAADYPASLERMALNICLGASVGYYVLYFMLAGWVMTIASWNSKAHYIREGFDAFVSLFKKTPSA